MTCVKVCPSHGEIGSKSEAWGRLSDNNTQSNVLENKYEVNPFLCLLM